MVDPAENSTYEPERGTISVTQPSGIPKKEAFERLLRSAGVERDTEKGILVRIRALEDKEILFLMNTEAEKRDCSVSLSGREVVEDFLSGRRIERPYRVSLNPFDIRALVVQYPDN